MGRAAETASIVSGDSRGCRLGRGPADRGRCEPVAMQAREGSDEWRRRAHRSVATWRFYGTDIGPSGAPRRRDGQDGRADRDGCPPVRGLALVGSAAAERRRHPAGGDFRGWQPDRGAPAGPGPEGCPPCRLRRPRPGPRGRGARSAFRGLAASRSMGRRAAPDGDRKHRRGPDLCRGLDGPDGRGRPQPRPSRTCGARAPAAAVQSFDVDRQRRDDA